MIARVFPRRTRATPDDANAYVGLPPFWAEADEVHISVTFTWDILRAERLADSWEKIAPVNIGGPALDDPGAEFVSGMYLKPGYTITSRGCPNRCWFCSVPKREGNIRELPIVNGWNVLDSNLLACSRPHIEAVFAMLSRQQHRAEFTGGLEAARLQDWHVELLSQLRPRPIVFFAYDTPDDYERLVEAGKRMQAAGFTRESHNLRAYVLVGYLKDAFDLAEIRLRSAWRGGFFPMAMLWRDQTGNASAEWRQFQRQWARPHIVACNLHR